MKKLFIITLLSVGVLGFTNLHTEAATFDISSYIGFGQVSNALGLAVNPDNGNIFLTTLSYGGEDNLWEFWSDGTLINSERVIGTKDIENDDSLMSVVVGKDGHLFANLADFVGPPTGSEWYIIEISQDGNTNYSSFRDESYTQGGSGITYNPDTQHLFISSYREKRIYEVTLDGTLINSFDVAAGNGPMDIAFDPFTESIFILYDDTDKKVLQYKRKGKGKKYIFLNTYDLSSVGITSHVLAMDINRSNGLFYIQENNTRVVEFDRVQLGMEPVPSDLLDFDIKNFGVIKRVSLSNERRNTVQIKLDVINNGTVDGGEVCDATVIGIQNSIEIYNETLSISVPFGNRSTTYQFPEFMPTVTGDIKWVATIGDDDPDVDEAVAYTTVNP
ncbi:MAG: hypothetical protein LWX51_18010 [Deltaproteobacteria bacterium]|nr:hypothetical protein [Deltaproteobacteria bacterium]